MAALPGCPSGEHVPQPAMLEDETGDHALRGGALAEPLRCAAGMLEVPKGPGLGMTLGEAAPRRFRPS